MRHQPGIDAGFVYETHIEAVSATEPFMKRMSIVDEVIEISWRVGIKL